MTHAKLELLSKLWGVVDALGEMGANNMGCLTHAQASLFHNATKMLQDLEEDLNDDCEGGEGLRLVWNKEPGHG